MSSAEQLYTIARALGRVPAEPGYSQLEVMRQANGLATHHDAVSGTEKAAVAGILESSNLTFKADYTTRLTMGTRAITPLIASAVGSLAKAQDEESEFTVNHFYTYLQA